MAGEVGNCHLINAPAGSGKTTAIGRRVQEIIFEHPSDNILCITFTNRAADELRDRLPYTNVFTGTIHSFLAAHMKRFFDLPGVVDLWTGEYKGEAIQERIENADKKDTIEQGNERFKGEHNGQLSIEVVRSSIKRLSYNETSFDSPYYGGMSHDTLLDFSWFVAERFPVVAEMIAAKYQHIFIDEYQDTSASVLKLFYEAVRGAKTRLYLYGDRMQQIYDNYDGSFEEVLKTFDDSACLRTNYRSSASIVALLNNLYNDERYRQEPAKPAGADGQMDARPVLKVVKSSKEAEASMGEDSLQLVLLNKERFGAIGAENLFKALKDMTAYAYGSKHTAVDILTTDAEDNPDILIRLIYLLFEMQSAFADGKPGLAIHTMRANGSIFNKDALRVESHADRVALHAGMTHIFDLLKKDVTIGDVVNEMDKRSFLSASFVDTVTAGEYAGVLGVSPREAKRAWEYLSDKHVSTQHGVKGESHDAVVFVAEDNRYNPLVNMSGYFMLLAKVEVSLPKFQEFYYGFRNCVKELEDGMGVKVTDLHANEYQREEARIRGCAESINKRFSGNEYYKQIKSGAYASYLAKRTKSNACDFLRCTDIKAILNAYKLFYVGCSRARKRLTVVVRNDMLHERDAQMDKFRQLGFEVVVS